MQNPTIKSIFSQMKLRYITQNEYQCKKAKLTDWYKKPYNMINKSELKEIASWYTKELNNPKPKLSIRQSDHKGLCLFTESLIPSGSLIGQYTGEIKKGRRKKTSDYSWHLPDSCSRLYQLELDAEKAGNELRFVNHSQAANIEAEYLIWKGYWIVIFRSKQEIQAESELTIDYGPDYWLSPDRELIISSEEFSMLEQKKPETQASGK